MKRVFISIITGNFYFTIMELIVTCGIIHMKSGGISRTYGDGINNAFYVENRIRVHYTPQPDTCQ